MLRLGKMEDIPKIMDFIKPWLGELYDEKLYSISEEYPTEEHFKKDILNNRCWVYEKEGNPIATVGGRLINDVKEMKAMEEEFTGDPWTTIDFNGGWPYWIVFRGFVNKKFSGKKYFLTLMELHKSLAKLMGANSIIACTDVNQKIVNKTLNRFGYEFRGNSEGEYKDKIFKLNYYELMLNK